MTSAYILIAAILLLGGLIAALGDRLGTKVGKARLRLFGLRPRQTAIVVTIMTGTFIAASTLAILFALSKSLRQGVFELDDILQKRRDIIHELTQVTKSKERVEAELKRATNEQAKVKQRLAETNQNYQLAQRQMQAISKQSNTLRVEVKKLLRERQQLKKEQEQLAGQIRTLKQQTSELTSEVRERNRELTERDSIIALREKKINQQNQTITQREQNIASLGKILVEQENRLAALEEQQELLQVEISVRDEKIVVLDEAITSLDTQLQDREAHLADLESQLVFLKRGVADLELSYQKLRQGNLALSRGEVLTFSLVRIDEPEKITQTIDGLLREANRIAIKKTETGNSSSKERVVQITQAEVNQLIQQIKDGSEYVVRILSAGNYVQGENLVRVFVDVTENMLIFRGEEVITSVSISPNSMTSEEMQERLNLLLSITEFRARSAGIIGEIKLGESYFSTLSSFFQVLKDSGSELNEIEAVAMESAYTAGPLQLNLVAIKDGEVVFSTAATATQ